LVILLAPLQCSRLHHCISLVLLFIKRAYEKKIDDSNKEPVIVKKNGCSKRAVARAKNVEIKSAIKGQCMINTDKTDELLISTPVHEDTLSDGSHSSPDVEYSIYPDRNDYNQVNEGATMDAEYKQNGSWDMPACTEQVLNAAQSATSNNIRVSNVYLKASVNGKVYKCHLEPDNDVSVFPRCMFTPDPSCVEAIQECAKPVAETLAAKNDMEIMFNFSGKLMNVYGIISETNHDNVLLGKDFLMANRAELNSEQNYLCMRGWKLKLFSEATRARCGRIVGLCDRSSKSDITRRELTPEMLFLHKHQKCNTNYPQVVPAMYNDHSAYNPDRLHANMGKMMPILRTCTVYNGRTNKH